MLHPAIGNEDTSSNFTMFNFFKQKNACSKNLNDMKKKLNINKLKNRAKKFHGTKLMMNTEQKRVTKLFEIIDIKAVVSLFIAILTLHAVL